MLKHVVVQPEQSIETIEEPKVLEWTLETDRDGDLYLAARLKGHSNFYYILRFNRDGQLIKYHSISRELGLRLDDLGRLLEVE